jgi:hypothetical protein
MQSPKRPILRLTKKPTPPPVPPVRLRIIPHQTPNPFTWDGSDLGVIQSSCIIGSVVSTRKRRYWHLDIGGHRVVCSVRMCLTSFPNIIDELKVVFGLPKVGTHRCILGSKNYILSKIDIDPVNGDIKEEITLDYIQPDTKLANGQLVADAMFVAQVQELFVFRELLGVLRVIESTVDVHIVPQRNGKRYTIYPVGRNETKMDPTQRELMIPRTIMDRWFCDTSIEDVTGRLVGIQSLETLSPGLASLRTRIENVVRRVDAQSIWISVYILERVMSRLLVFTTEAPNGKPCEDRVIGLDASVPRIIPYLEYEIQGFNAYENEAESELLVDDIPYIPDIQPEYTDENDLGPIGLYERSNWDKRLLPIRSDNESEAEAPIHQEDDVEQDDVEQDDVEQDDVEQEEDDVASITDEIEEDDALAEGEAPIHDEDESEAETSIFDEEDGSPIPIPDRKFGHHPV